MIDNKLYGRLRIDTYFSHSEASPRYDIERAFDRNAPSVDAREST
jgi:hypothetical protein